MIKLSHVFGLALAAVTLALAGGGTPAQAQQGTVRCDDCFAFVDENGTLQRNRGATSATPLLTGRYEVRFVNRLDGCAWQGTLARGTDGNIPHGNITVVGRSGTNDGLFVETRNANGVFVDRPFGVRIAC